MIEDNHNHMEYETLAEGCVMAMQTKDIYDHHRKHVGKIEIYRKTAKAHVFFKNDTHYANRTLEIEEIDQYMKNFGFMFEEDLNQLTLEDLF